MNCYYCGYNSNCVDHYNILTSSRFANQVSLLQKRNFNQLFDEYAGSNRSFDNFYAKIKEKTDAEMKNNIAMINAATELKVKEYVEQGDDFKILRQEIFDVSQKTINDRLDSLSKSLIDSESNRVHRLKSAENDIVINRYWLGSLSFAAVLGVVGKYFNWW